MKLWWLCPTISYRIFPWFALLMWRPLWWPPWVHITTKYLTPAKATLNGKTSNSHHLNIVTLISYLYTFLSFYLWKVFYISRFSAFRFRRRTHVTPKSYLSFINGYKTLYSEKYSYINTLAERMNVGKSVQQQAMISVKKPCMENVASFTQVNNFKRCSWFAGLDKLMEAGASVAQLAKDLEVKEKELAKASVKANKVKHTRIHGPTQNTFVTYHINIWNMSIYDNTSVTDSI